MNKELTIEEIEKADSFELTLLSKFYANQNNLHLANFTKDLAIRKVKKEILQIDEIHKKEWDLNLIKVQKEIEEMNEDWRKKWTLDKLKAVKK